MVEDKILYTFRGWLAFVAFMDLGVTFRSFFENKCIIGTQTNLQADEHFIHGTNNSFYDQQIIYLICNYQCYLYFGYFLNINILLNL